MKRVMEILGLMGLMGLMPLAHAQTNAADGGTVVSPADAAPVPAVTNAPAAIAPPLADAPVPPLPAPSAPQLNPLNGLNPASATKPEEIADIRPPLFFFQPWFWLWLALGLIAVVAALAVLWTRFRPHRLLSARSAYELTLEKLEQARALLREENPMPYAVLVSEVIRTYLGQRFQTPSTRLTTDEFLRKMEADPSTPLAEHRDLLRHFLQACDLVKFARYQPTLAELEAVHERACTFVTATKPLPASNQPGVKP